LGAKEEACGYFRDIKFKFKAKYKTRSIEYSFRITQLLIGYLNIIFIQYAMSP
jgi:hypothetical protein